MSSYRDSESDQIRVLFCLGVSQSFFDQDSSSIPPLVEVIKEAFADLKGRFGITVLGTLDDDELMVGPSRNFPWTAYILADAPNLKAITEVCNILRETEVDGSRLWKYMRIEARAGRELFFGNT